MDAEKFLKLRRGDVIELPMDQQRIIDCPPNPLAMPWCQVATTTEPWYDAQSERHQFFVDCHDVVAVAR